MAEPAIDETARMIDAQQKREDADNALRPRRLTAAPAHRSATG